MDPFKGDFVIYPDGSVVSARDIRTNSILPFSGNIVNVPYPYTLLVNNLSAISATVNYQNILVNEISGFIVNGSDTTDTIHDILIEGANNLVLKLIPISSTSWATFDKDLQTKRNLYVSGVANIFGANITNLTATNLSAYNANTYNLTGFNNWFTNETVTNSNITNLTATNLSAYNETVTNSNITNLTATNAIITNCISTNCISPYNTNLPITIYGNLDMSGFSISGINNDSISFQSGAKISSDTLGRFKLSAYSVSEMDECSAVEQYSHAEGYKTLAYLAAHAEGSQTQALCAGSHAEGNGAKATEVYAHAEGGVTIASGAGSHAEGFYTKASGLYSHAGGSGGNGSDKYTILASGMGSFAHGADSPYVGKVVAAGHAAIAMGYAVSALSYASHAEGYETLATGGYGAHAEGERSWALSSASHAEGYYTTAAGVGAHAEGWGTEALGEASHAGGYHSYAKHDRTFVWSSLDTAVSSTLSAQFTVSADNGVVLGPILYIDGSVSLSGQVANSWSEAVAFAGGSGSGDAEVNALVHSNSGNWDGVYTTVNTSSGSWGGGGKITTSLSYSPTAITDLSTGDIFTVTLTGDFFLDNPINGSNGNVYVWRIRQDAVGSHTIGLGTKFRIPSSATTPLAWSTTASAMDIFAAECDTVEDKFYVLSMIPGY